MPLTLNDFDYTLPAELIAQAPLAERSASRLLVVSPNADGVTETYYAISVERRLTHPAVRAISEAATAKQKFV